VSRAAAVLFLLIAAAGCDKLPPLEKVPASEIAIGRQVTVRTDTVGHDQFARASTFALVDADNSGDRPAHVTLGGVLVDTDGQEVGKLRTESLWVPAHGRRTFALVDNHDQVRATATAARIDLRGATRPRHDEPIKVEQGHVWKDNGRVVATGMVVNTADRPCNAVVLAGFHDASGAPVSRMFSVFPIGAKIERPTRFVGPEGSTTGYIFIGQIRC
jgi:hypothetical protein